MKKKGVFIFVIFHIVPEIFTIFVLCKLGTDDVITVWKSKHKVENISASKDAKQLELGKHVVHYEIRHMMHILMLLWQHPQFQIAIMQEWLPLYLILSKHCPLPKG